MAEKDKKRYFYKRLDQVNKANPAFGDTPVQDRNMLVAFILAIKYIYSYECHECEQRPKIDNWLNTSAANWYYSGSFDEPRCVDILNQFRKNFSKYKDLDCFKCFANSSTFNIQTADPYNYYIFNETEDTQYVFDLNEYLDSLVDEKGNLLSRDNLNKNAPKEIPDALKKLEQAIIKNANKLVKEKSAAKNIVAGI